MAQISISNSVGSRSKSSAPPVNKEAPRITGDANVGNIVSCSEGVWTGTQPIRFSFQWERNRVPIVDATSTEYTIVSGDVQQSIKCLVTATNELGISGVYSNIIIPK